MEAMDSRFCDRRRFRSINECHYSRPGAPFFYPPYHFLGRYDPSFPIYPRNDHIPPFYNSNYMYFGCDGMRQLDHTENGIRRSFSGTLKEFKSVSGVSNCRSEFITSYGFSDVRNVTSSESDVISIRDVSSSACTGESESDALLTPVFKQEDCRKTASMQHQSCIPQPCTQNSIMYQHHHRRNSNGSDSVSNYLTSPAAGPQDDPISSLYPIPSPISLTMGGNNYKTHSPLQNGSSLRSAQQPDNNNNSIARLPEHVVSPDWVNFISSINLQQLEDTGSRFQYILGAATSPAIKLDEESVTYLNQGQSYEIKLKRLIDLPEEQYLKCVVRVIFHERRLQYMEREQLDAWRQSRPGERILDIDVPISYGLVDLHIDSDALNSLEFTWNPECETGVYVRINCISTEFTPRKHGGEKGVPFRLQVETYSVGSKPTYTRTDQRQGNAGMTNQNCLNLPSRSNSSESELLHCASCQVKVFKPKGADRKHKTDREKLEKMTHIERDKYQQSFEYSIFTEIPVEQVNQYLAQLRRQQEDLALAGVRVNGVKGGGGGYGIIEQIREEKFCPRFDQPDFQRIKFSPVTFENKIQNTGNGNPACVWDEAYGWVKNLSRCGNAVRSPPVRGPCVKNEVNYVNEERRMDNTWANRKDLMASCDDVRAGFRVTELRLDSGGLTPAVDSSTADFSRSGTPLNSPEVRIPTEILDTGLASITLVRDNTDIRLAASIGNIVKISFLEENVIPYDNNYNDMAARHISTSMTSQQVIEWLRVRHFSSENINLFKNFSGADLMRLSRADLIEMCGRAEGIRLDNALHARHPRPRLTIYVMLEEEHNNQPCPVSASTSEQNKSDSSSGYWSSASISSSSVFSPAHSPVLNINSPSLTPPLCDMIEDTCEAPPMGNRLKTKRRSLSCGTDPTNNDLWPLILADYSEGRVVRTNSGTKRSLGDAVEEERDCGSNGVSGHCNQTQYQEVGPPPKRRANSNNALLESCRYNTGVYHAVYLTTLSKSLLLKRLSDLFNFDSRRVSDLLIEQTQSDLQIHISDDVLENLTDNIKYKVTITPDERARESKLIVILRPENSIHHLLN